MSKDKKADGLLQKIKKLLRAGQTKSAIGAILFLNRYKMDKVMQQLILSNMKCRKRISKLTAYDSLIRTWVAEGKNIKTIQGNLAVMQRPVHYTTVWKYIQTFSKIKSEQTFTNLPGEVAYVSLLQIKQSKGAYLFCLLMGYSHFSYFSVMSHLGLPYFIQCHVDCFNQLGGVPENIQFCEVSCLCLSTRDRRTYQNFLAYYGTRQVNRFKAISNRHLCINHSQRAKKRHSQHFLSWRCQTFGLLVKNKTQQFV